MAIKLTMWARTRGDFRVLAFKKYLVIVLTYNKAYTNPKIINVYIEK